MFKNEIVRYRQKTLRKRILKLKKNATRAEKIVYDYLSDNDVKFIFQKGFISGSNYVIVDFYLPKPYKVCIEIDGGYHNTTKQQHRDRNRDDYLINERGFRVYHFLNSQIYKNVQVLDKIIHHEFDEISMRELINK